MKMNVIPYKQSKKGSITVEAALVLPIFLFAISAFLYFFQIILIQEKLQLALSEVAKEMSQFAYIHQKKDQRHNLIGMAGAKAALLRYLDVEEINNSCIEGGYGGISFLNSSILEGENIIDIVIQYKVRPRVPLLRFQSYQIMQRVKTKGFVGTRTGKEKEGGTGKEEDRGEENETVYVAETGQVYHKNRNCTHIKLSIITTKYQDVINMRNSYGGKYKKCALCSREGTGEIFVALEGDRYHYSMVCSGLKRTIRAVSIKDAVDLLPCSRCAGGS